MSKPDKTIRSVTPSTFFAQADLLAAGSAADYTAAMTILVEPI
jgi:hypothetical protein